MREDKLTAAKPGTKSKEEREVIPFATNKLRILGKTKDPVTGEFSPALKQPAPKPKPKPTKKAS